MSKEKSQFPKEISKKGEFKRQKSSFNNEVTADGSSGFKAEPKRYHLYVSLACPWAHRTVIFRKLKKLEEVISLTVVDPIRDEGGWAFTDSPGCNLDLINNFEFLKEAYLKTDPKYNMRVTVPVLWDKKKKIIVSNESANIIRMLNSEFNKWGDSSVDFYPENLRKDIDEINKKVYENVNNGVYRAGFATTQEAYEEAFNALFKTLDELENILSKQRYLVGNKITEADWRLFTTLVRFDSVYYSHFKCNLKRLIDYENLWNYTKELYQHPGIAETVNLDHIKRHYYITHKMINPTGIVPKGPKINFLELHNRGKL